jgi:hypothetical protein
MMRAKALPNVFLIGRLYVCGCLLTSSRSPTYPPGFKPEWGKTSIQADRTPRSPGLCAHRRYFQTFLVLIVELWADTIGVQKRIDASLGRFRCSFHNHVEKMRLPRKPSVAGNNLTAKTQSQEGPPAISIPPLRYQWENASTRLAA